MNWLIGGILVLWILGGISFGTLMKETGGPRHPPLWVLMIWPLWVLLGILWGGMFRIVRLRK